MPNYIKFLFSFFFERVDRIELTSQAWKASVITIIRHPQLTLIVSVDQTGLLGVVNTYTLGYSY